MKEPYWLTHNGWEFYASEVEVVLHTLALAAGELSEAGYGEWLKANSRRT